MRQLTLKNQHPRPFLGPFPSPFPSPFQTGRQHAPSKTNDYKNAQFLMLTVCIKSFIHFIGLLLISFQCSASTFTFPVYAQSQYKAANQKKIDHWLKLANKNDPDAQFELGIAYQTGTGVEKNINTAMHWYEKAASSQLAGAQNNLGCLLIEAHSGPEHTSRGVDLLRQSADAESIHAKMNLITLLIGGDAIQQDQKAGFELALKTAEQSKRPDIQFAVGLYYKGGIGTKADLHKAANFFTLASKADHSGAQLQLGLLYKNGTGVPVSLEKSLQYYNTAANNGNATAMVVLGVMYQNGDGVKQDNAKALNYYLRGAAQGSSQAEFNIGTMYELGIGLVKDNKKALSWYKKSALKGNPKAQFFLGMMLFETQDSEDEVREGYQWILKASKQGHKDAQAAITQIHDSVMNQL